MPSLPPIRIAVGLSGGVDSSVSALFLKSCVHSARDINAFRCAGKWSVGSKQELVHWSRAGRIVGDLGGGEVGSTAAAAAPPPLPVLMHALTHRTPWSDVILPAHKKGLCTAYPQLLGTAVSAVTEDEQGTNDQALATGVSLVNPVDLLAPVEIQPVYFLCWGREDGGDDNERGWCSESAKDYEDAQETAHTLGLLPRTSSLPILDLRAAYEEDCFTPMLSAYAKGETLNVDVLCNEKIKFGAALEQLLWLPPSSSSSSHPLVFPCASGSNPTTTSRTGSCRSSPSAFAAPTLLPSWRAKCHYLCTGHYARTVLLPKPVETVGMDASTTPPPQQPMAWLAKPFTADSDPLNDQVHFLARVPPSALSHALFPLGHLFRSKKEVRQVAEAFGLNHVANKKTSTGMCMVYAHKKKKETVVKQIGMDKGRSGEHLACIPHREFTRNDHVESATRRRSPSSAITLQKSKDNNKSSLRFPHFLHEHIPMPGCCHVAAGAGTGTGTGSNPPRTRFIVRDSGESLSLHQFHWDEKTRALLEGTFDGLLPAYCFTVGQKLQYSRQRTGCDRGSTVAEEMEKEDDDDRSPAEEKPKQSGCGGKELSSPRPEDKKPRMETYYVCDKWLHPSPRRPSPCCSAEVRVREEEEEERVDSGSDERRIEASLLSTVVLVPAIRPHHPVLMRRETSLRHVRVFWADREKTTHEGWWWVAPRAMSSRGGFFFGNSCDAGSGKEHHPLGNEWRCCGACPCLCATRHQEPLRQATLFLFLSRSRTLPDSPSAHAEEETTKHENEGEYRGLVRWEDPSGIRVPAPGQLFVAYLPLDSWRVLPSAVTSAATTNVARAGKAVSMDMGCCAGIGPEITTRRNSDKYSESNGLWRIKAHSWEADPQSPLKRRSDLVVIASGWVTD